MKHLPVSARHFLVTARRSLCWRLLLSLLLDLSASSVNGSLKFQKSLSDEHCGQDSFLNLLAVAENRSKASLVYIGHDLTDLFCWLHKLNEVRPLHYLDVVWEHLGDQFVYLGWS